MSRSRPALDLLLVSGLILFLELALIRWLPAHVLFLSFFTNTVLLACFVGMSIGCLTARKPTREIDRTPFWLLLTVAAGLLVGAFRKIFERHTTVDNQANPDVVFFGTEISATRPTEFTVPVEVVAGAFFFLVAAVMVGPGQELGRAFSRIASRSRSYALDLTGSLLGIGLFAVASWFWLPPVAWFAIASLGLIYFLRKRDGEACGTEGCPLPVGSGSPCRYIMLGIAVGLTTLTSGLWVGHEGKITRWSPYYRIDFEPRHSIVTANLIGGHQRILALDHSGTEQYSWPHLFRRDVQNPDGKPAWQPFRRVLIIGAGSGNDLARAVQWCPKDAKIDAVEIDPVIQRIGFERNHDRPYQDPRVTPHLNDGRNFLRTAPAEEYDLVVFALVDSLVLHSGYSNLRLESYLFTRESFRDVRRVLKPSGVCFVYNYFRQGWIAGRLRNEMQEELGGEPVVLTDPPVEYIAANHFDPNLATVFVGGSKMVLDPLRESFQRGGNSYWIPGDRPRTPDVPGHFQATIPGKLPPPAEPPPPETKPTDWVRLRIATLDDSSREIEPATDDWPFLYSQARMVPGYTLRGITVVLLLSGLLWLWFGRSAEVPRNSEDGSTPESPEPPPERSDTDLLLRSFFLGCGFMLIETKAVVQMALLFGSTWSVNTVVFAAILVMALAGNLFAAIVKPTQLWPYYLGLFAALGANLLVPMDSFLGMDPVDQVLASCGLVFAPVAFAGVIFPVSFARAPFPDRFFGANVAGALVGGLVENASMLLGFRGMLVLAVVFYAASGLFSGRSVPSPEAERGV